MSAHFFILLTWWEWFFWPEHDEIYLVDHLENPVMICFMPMHGSSRSYRSKLISLRLRSESGPPCGSLNKMVENRNILFFKNLQILVIEAAMLISSLKISFHSISIICKLLFQVFYPFFGLIVIESTRIEDSTRWLSLANGWRGGTFFSVEETRPAR